MQEEDINKEDIKKMIKGLKKYMILIVIICLFFLFYQLGFIWGFNQAFHLQEDFYEEKMMKYCICQDSPTYNIPNKPLEILNATS